MKKKNIRLSTSLFFIPAALAVFASCSSNPLLTQTVQVNEPQQIQLEKEVQRASNEVTYPSNLSNFTYPSQEELLQEANIKNISLYKQNVGVLSDWINKKLSYKQKNQLSENCQVLVGKFDSQFPLNETTVACIAWWIERKNKLLEQNPKNVIDDKPIVMMNSAQKKNWANFKNLTITQSLQNIDMSTREDRINYERQALLVAKDCSFKNANAALFFKMENFLPDTDAYKSIVNIYNHMQECLVANEEPSEKVNLRMGLLHLLQGKINLAFEALKKTQLETDPKENSRNLFWLGVVFKKLHPEEKINIYWELLKKENPLSLASLVAYEQQGLDPMTMLVPDERISLQKRGEGGWIKDNLETFVFDVFMSKKDIKTADGWANYVTKKLTTTNPNLMLYWAISQHKLHNYYSSIQMVSKYSRLQKNYIVSRGLLDLQFPRPFMSELVEKKSDVDPIFVLSLMRQESAFDEYAHSVANARGLMQILPKTAKLIRKSLHSQDLYDPDTNIEIGELYLDKLFTKYEGKAEYVLAAYNAGPVNLDKWLTRVSQDNSMLFCDFIPYRETRSYISIILRNYYWYTKIISQSDEKIDKLMLKKSYESSFKSHRVQALIRSTTQNASLSEAEKDLLNGIYVFGGLSDHTSLSYTHHKSHLH